MKDSINIPEKVSNLTYLTQLSKGNTEFVQEMLAIFLEENPIEIKSFEDAIKEKDFEQIQAIAHHMKSTTPFVGIDTHIREELIETEKLAKLKTDIDTISIHFTKIKRICLKALEELNSGITK
jgi:HPt (histidine-containing phosphotransfer) domain-containing protein